MISIVKKFYQVFTQQYADSTISYNWFHRQNNTYMRKFHTSNHPLSTLKHYGQLEHQQVAITLQVYSNVISFIIQNATLNDSKWTYSWTTKANVTIQPEHWIDNIGILFGSLKKFALVRHNIPQSSTIWKCWQQSSSNSGVFQM